MSLTHAMLSVLPDPGRWPASFLLDDIQDRDAGGLAETHGARTKWFAQMGMLQRGEDRTGPLARIRWPWLNATTNARQRSAFTSRQPYGKRETAAGPQGPCVGQS